jgi:hypothetical protein
VKTDSHLNLSLLQRKEYLDYLEVSWRPALNSRAQKTQLLRPAEASSSNHPSVTLLPSSIDKPAAITDAFVDEEDPDDLTTILDPHPLQAETAEDLDPGDTSDVEEVVDAQDNLDYDEDDSESTAVNTNSLNFTIDWNVPVGRPPHCASPSAYSLDSKTCRWTFISNTT